MVPQPLPSGVPSSFTVLLWSMKSSRTLPGLSPRRPPARCPPGQERGSEQRRARAAAHTGCLCEAKSASQRGNNPGELLAAFPSAALLVPFTAGRPLGAQSGAELSPNSAAAKSTGRGFAEEVQFNHVLQEEDSAPGSAWGPRTLPRAPEAIVPALCSSLISLLTAKMKNTQQDLYLPQASHEHPRNL